MPRISASPALALAAALVLQLVNLLAPFEPWGRALLVGCAYAIGLIAFLWATRLHELPRTVLWKLLFTYLVMGLAGSAAYAAAFAAGLASPQEATWAAVPWLAAYVPLALALIIMIARREPMRLVVVDLVALTTTLLMVVALFVVLPAFDKGSPAPVLQTALLIADALVLAATIRLLACPAPRPRATLMTAAAMFAVVGSDLAWNWVSVHVGSMPGQWAWVGWLLAPCLLGAAPLHPSARGLHQRAPGEARNPWTAALLGATSLVAPLLLILSDLVPFGISRSAVAVTVLICGPVVAATVAVRVVMLVRGGNDLAAQLSEILAERERLLMGAEARYRSLIESLPGVVFTATLPDGGGWPRAVYVSPQSRQILGLDPTELMRDSRTFYRLVHPDDLARIMDAAGATYGPPTDAQPEFRVVKPDGGEVWLRSEASVVADDTARYIQGVFFDVTQRKRAEAERDAFESDLRLGQKLESVGQLAAGIAHEINTPVQFVGDTVRFLDDAFGDLVRVLDAHDRVRAAALAGTIDADLLAAVAEEEEIADVEYLRERVPQAFERAFEGIRRVAEIVSAMREFAHPPTTEKAPVDINDAICNTLVVARNEFKYVADVEADLGEIPRVICNAGDMNQVFLNLIVNAAHAIEEVVRDNGDRGTIRITTRVDGDDVVIAVTDTGCGVPDEIAARLFDPFFTTKEVGRGTGQGLAIVRSIVKDKHDGDVHFEPAEGGGTTFGIRVPIAGHGAPAAPIETATAALEPA